MDMLHSSRIVGDYYLSGVTTIGPFSCLYTRVLLFHFI